MGRDPVLEATTINHELSAEFTMGAPGEPGGSLMTDATGQARTLAGRHIQHCHLQRNVPGKMPGLAPP
jgi:hypothetical protein